MYVSTSRVLNVMNTKCVGELVNSIDINLDVLLYRWSVQTICRPLNIGQKIDNNIVWTKQIIISPNVFLFAKSHSNLIWYIQLLWHGICNKLIINLISSTLLFQTPRRPKKSDPLFRAGNLCKPSVYSQLDTCTA